MLCNIVGASAVGAGGWLGGGIDAAVHRIHETPLITSRRSEQRVFIGGCNEAPACNNYPCHYGIYCGTLCGPASQQLLPLRLKGCRPERLYPDDILTVYACPLLLLNHLALQDTINIHTRVRYPQAMKIYTILPAWSSTVSKNAKLCMFELRTSP